MKSKNMYAFAIGIFFFLNSIAAQTRFDVVDNQVVPSLSYPATMAESIGKCSISVVSLGLGENMDARSFYSYTDARGYTLLSLNYNPKIYGRSEYSIRAFQDTIIFSDRDFYTNVSGILYFTSEVQKKVIQVKNFSFTVRIFGRNGNEIVSAIKSSMQDEVLNFIYDLPHCK